MRRPRVRRDLLATCRASGDNVALVHFATKDRQPDTHWGHLAVAVCRGTEFYLVDCFHGQVAPRVEEKVYRKFRRDVHYYIPNVRRSSRPRSTPPRSSGPADWLRKLVKQHTSTEQNHWHVCRWLRATLDNIDPTISLDQLACTKCHCMLETDKIEYYVTSGQPYCLGCQYDGERTSKLIWTDPQLTIGTARFTLSSAPALFTDLRSCQCNTVYIFCPYVNQRDDGVGRMMVGYIAEDCVYVLDPLHGQVHIRFPTSFRDDLYFTDACIFETRTTLSGQPTRGQGGRGPGPFTFVILSTKHEGCAASTENSLAQLARSTTAIRPFR